MQTIPSYTDEQLEKKAEEFLAEYAKRDGCALLLELVIENFGYEIFPVPGLAVIAEAYIPAKPGLIFMDEEQYMSSSFRGRFTLAEELAHIILHRPLFEGLNAQQIQEFQEKLSDPQYQQIEREAKYLAGALLMPRQMFMERFKTHQEIQRERQQNELQILRRTIRSLNIDFNASCHSIAIRAMCVGLIDQQQLDDYLSTLSN